MTPRARRALALVVATLGAGAAPFAQAGCGSDSSSITNDASTVDTSTSASDGALVDTSTSDTGESADAGFDAPEPFFDCTPDASAGVVPPHDLRCTTLYDRWSRKTISVDNQEYKPAYVLWSDGADKRRWAHFPAGTKIDTHDMDAWTFPIGTKFWKEFSFNGAPVETRYFEKIGDNSWIWTTYVWSTDLSSAVSLDTGSGEDAGGDASYAGYEIPDHDKCNECHQGGADTILGFEAVLIGLPGATGLTLDALSKQGLMTDAPPKTTLALPNELTGKDDKALGYLQANCGVSCHNVRGDANMFSLNKIFYAQLYADGGTPKVTALDSYTTTLGVPASIGAAKRMVAGHPETSAMYVLANERNAIDPKKNQMPFVGSHEVDTAGVADLGAWITAIP